MGGCKHILAVGCTTGSMIYSVLESVIIFFLFSTIDILSEKIIASIVAMYGRFEAW